MTHPNIIYILADDMGYGDLSCLNEESKIHTENLDRLASQGMIFRDAHSTSSVCTPSRYSLLTGRYNWRSRLKHGVNWGYSERLIEEGRMTVPSLLKSHGYNTGCVGKWHLGWSWGKKANMTEPVDSFRDTPDFPGNDVDFSLPITGGPTAVGFDYYFGISASLDMAPYVYVENDRVTAQPDRIIPEKTGKQFWREGPIAPDFAHEDVLPTLTRKAVQYVDDHAQQDAPFFLYFPLPAPHTPILPLPQFQGKSGTNEYGDFCLQVDDLVGQIMAALDRNGIAENTILVFTSDNGFSPMGGLEELKAVGHKPSYVFRGHKFDIYEGGHRMPLVIRWPETIAAGTASDETVCLADLLATGAEIVGEPLPPNAGEDSVSNLSVWKGGPVEQSQREGIVHSSMNGSLSIRKGKWKLEMCPGSGGQSYPRPGPETEGLPPIQLYDLDADVGERQNLQAEHPEVVEELTNLLTTYIVNGRSIPGEPQQNADDILWPQLWWIEDSEG